jgi:hypothetical protein
MKAATWGLVVRRKGKTTVVALLSRADSEPHSNGSTPCRHWMAGKLAMQSA